MYDVGAYSRNFWTSLEETIQTDDLHIIEFVPKLRILKKKQTLFPIYNKNLKEMVI